MKILAAHSQKLAVFTGILGSMVALYILWAYHLFQPLDPFNRYDNAVFSFHALKHIWSLFFLFLPACLAFTAAIFQKVYLMVLAFLISLPAGEYLETQLGTFFSVHHPLYLYAASILLMTLKKKQ
ncbi:hypothetical protein [Bacillus taeanensis]|uniref:Uncharacterized protein n=1 Tax=Bacillus taeanensis TaxID=273032 RepID=A0A366XLR0_9BACI|nr:hypothetical protein [Bacillus taeanensis]RBW67310.1 hypothetical protein DS031_22865 [Bacillus taeanensis]